jgi:uncharacterized protein (TIGR00730 family)
MKVTVFGGSQPEPGSPVYQEAYLLGKLLAEAGHTVLTGGYIGTMEAVSRGAAEAGGHVVGVTCAEIERWRPVKANGWVKEEWRRETLLERLHALVTECDAAIALPGGPGTLTEIALTWNMIIIGARPPIPLVLVGDGWQSVAGQVFSTLGDYTPEVQRELLTFVPDVRAAVARLANS